MFQLKYSNVLMGLLIVIPFFFVSCQKRFEQIDNLNDGKVFILSKAEESSLFPTNSMASFQKAIEDGAQGIAIDVQLSKDCVLVLFQAIRLEESTKGEGYIHEMVWDSLKHIEYKRSSEKLICLDTLLQTLNRDVLISLNCKLYKHQNIDSYVSQFAETIKGYKKNYYFDDRVLLISSLKSLLYQFFLDDNTYSLFFYTSSVDSAIQLDKELPLEGLAINNEYCDKLDVELAHLDSLKVMIVDVTSSNANSLAIRKQVDYIQTDALKDLLRKLND